MDSNKKLEFIHKMAKLGLAHFDSGGPVDPGALLNGPSNGGVNNTATNPNTGIVGTIGQALGLNNNFQAGAANIQAGTNQSQLNSAYSGVQNTLGNENALVTTLQPQATSGVAEQNMLAAQLEAQANGAGPNVAQNELNQATGQNVASQAALMAGQRGSNSNVGLAARNIAQQGAATQQQASGQAATLAAQQQIAAQQGLQGLAANQVSQAGQAVNNASSAAQSEQGILQNANTSYNNAGVGMQSNINNNNAATSAANQNMGSNIFGGLAAGASALLSSFAEGGEADSDEGKFEPANADVSSPDIPSTPELPSSGKDKGGGNPAQLVGAAATLASILAAKGGKVTKKGMKYADGGLAGNPLTNKNFQVNQPSFSGQWLANTQATNAPNVGGAVQLPENKENFRDDVNDMVEKLKKKHPSDPYGPSTDAGDKMEDNLGENSPANIQLNDIEGEGPEGPYVAEGGEIDHMMTEKEAVQAQIRNQNGQGIDQYLKKNTTTTLPAKQQDAGSDQDHTTYEAKGGKVKNMASRGGKVTADNKSEKAKVPGNSYSNDKIPAMLSEKEIVLPREITMHPNAPEMAAEFVRRIQAKKGFKRGLA